VNKENINEGILAMLRGRFRPLVTMACMYLITAFVLRLGLWGIFGRHFQVSFLKLPIIVILGFLNDIAVLPPLLLPLSLILLILPTWHREASWRRMLAHAVSMATIFGFVYLALAQYFFFDEFNGRFNLVAVDYLIYPNEVFVNIWQTYHVIWFLLATSVISVVSQMIFAARLVRSKMPSCRFVSRLKFVGIHVVLTALVLLAFSTDSLSLFNNRVANEITANGISSFFRALHTNELDFNRYYRTLASDKAFAIIQKELRLPGQDKPHASKDLNRNFPGYADGLGKLNIVAIVEESFGAQFVGAYGDKRGLTPNFDRLSHKGLLFANAYASGTRTVRGLGAIVTSMPPIPSEGIMKRPGSEGMANWGEVLKGKGYQTSFLYGGHGVFDNMNHFFSTNGFAISDIADIKEITQRTIWGVCDEDIFRHAVKYYDAAATKGKPFFSVIMTTSNHQPYTFPAGIPNVPVKGGGRIAGVRYADYAIGKFIEQAEGTSWGRNTLFIIVADHDARVYGSEQVPMRHYRIPMLFLAPGHLRPRVVNTAMGQLDIAPTVMGILGLPFTAPFYGQDVLHWPADKPRPILINHDHDVALLLGSKLAVLGLHKAVNVYDYDEANLSISKTVGDPQSLMVDGVPLIDMATAYFQTAFELFKAHGYKLPEN
jgi:phosphoglycerol transferase MdoB-like AlkP superfamily enzyme